MTVLMSNHYFRRKTEWFVIVCHNFLPFTNEVSFSILIKCKAHILDFFVLKSYLTTDGISSKVIVQYCTIQCIWYQLFGIILITTNIVNTGIKTENMIRSSLKHFQRQYLPSVNHSQHLQQTNCDFFY